MRPGAFNSPEVYGHGKHIQNCGVSFQGRQGHLEIGTALAEGAATHALSSPAGRTQDISFCTLTKPFDSICCEMVSETVASRIDVRV